MVMSSFCRAPAAVAAAALNAIVVAAVSVATLIDGSGGLLVTPPTE